MIKTTRTVEQHHRVFTSFDPNDVRALLLERAAELHGLDVERLRVPGVCVDLSGNSTSYVRGQVPLTREELLETLGPSHAGGGAGAETPAPSPRVVSAEDLEFAVEYLAGIADSLLRADVVDPDDVELVIRKLGGRR